MTKYLKKEKINYLRGTKTYLDNTISLDNINSNNINNNNNNNNNINTTLTNISNQLKNMAIVDKNKEFKLLNSSFRKNNKNARNNIISNNINNINNNFINSSLNIDNNQNQNKSNFFDITSNSEIHQKFQNLQKIKVSDFYIIKQINFETTNYEEIKKENLELKENIKFLLKQIKKYQKSGITIEDMNINRQQELENLEKKINELNEQINAYKKKIILLDNNNNKLTKENLELRNYISINLQKEKQYKINNKIKNKEFNGLQKNQEYEQYYDIGGFDEKNLEYKNLNILYNQKLKNIIENDITNNSKLSEELLADNINQLNNAKNKDSFLYIKEYSNHANKFRKDRSGFSEGKLYFRKNIGKRFLSFNDELYNTKKSSNNNFTYSKSYLKNNISFKK